VPTRNSCPGVARTAGCSGCKRYPERAKPPAGRGRRCSRRLDRQASVVEGQVCPPSSWLLRVFLSCSCHALDTGPGRNCTSGLGPRAMRARPSARQLATGTRAGFVRSLGKPGLEPGGLLLTVAPVLKSQNAGVLEEGKQDQSDKNPQDPREYSRWVFCFLIRPRQSTASRRSRACQPFLPRRRSMFLFSLLPALDPAPDSRRQIQHGARGTKKAAPEPV